MFHVQAAPKAQMEEAGRLWALRSTDCRQEPLEVRKRSPHIFDQFVGVRVGFFVVSFLRALLPCESQQLIFERRAWKHLPEYQGCVRKRPPCPCWEHQSHKTSFVSVSSALPLILLRTRLWRAFRQS